MEWDFNFPIFAIEFKLWISIFSRECVVSYRVAGRSQGEEKALHKKERKREKLNSCIHTHIKQTDVSAKWKSDRSHKFPSTLNTQNILCCVCRSKLVFQLGTRFWCWKSAYSTVVVFYDGNYLHCRFGWTIFAFHNANVNAFIFLWVQVEATITTNFSIQTMLSD